MGPRQRRATWAAATAAGVLLALAPAVLGLRTLSHRDTERLYAPVRTLVVEELRAGRLPLWNPYEATGSPLFAEGIHSVLHPISLAAAALAPSNIDFLILAYLVAAALGAFVLALALGASHPASAGAGLAFALSGYSVSMTGNLVFLAGLSTLPWVVAAARAAGAGARWGAVAAALATASAFFSGDAQVALVGLALGTLLAADAGGARGVARALVGMGAGILLGGVQIAATRELITQTFRSLTESEGLPEAEKVYWALEPGRLLEWVLPGLFRGPLAEIPTGATGTLAPVFAESVYLGAPLLLAAGGGALWRRRPTGFLLAVAAGTLLWLALGHRLGARQLLDWIPVWNRFRYSEKLLAPLTLCACALGALGIDAFASARLSTNLKRALAASILAAGVALITLLVAPAATTALAVHLLADAGPFYRSTLAAGLPHLLASLVALLAVDRLARPAPRASALALLVALTPAAASYYGAHLGSPQVRRFSSAMRLETDSPAPRIAHPADHAAFLSGDGDRFEAAARITMQVMYPAVNVARRVDTVEPYGAFAPRRLTTLAESQGIAWARSFRRYGLTHLAIPLPWDIECKEVTDVAIEDARLVERDVAQGFEVWAVPHRPWAFFAHRAVAAAAPQDSLRTVLDLIGSGDDATVVVEAPESPPTAPGHVLHVERGTESVRLEAESLGPALLVVQDAFWPGWRAAIDGGPVEILAADHLVRAVRWPPGRHRLEMTYDPPEIRLGLALSALGAILVLLLAVLAARQRPPAFPPPAKMVRVPPSASLEGEP